MEETASGKENIQNMLFDPQDCQIVVGPPPPKKKKKGEWKEGSSEIYHVPLSLDQSQDKIAEKILYSSPCPRRDT